MARSGKRDSTDQCDTMQKRRKLSMKKRKMRKCNGKLAKEIKRKRKRTERVK